MKRLLALVTWLIVGLPSIVSAHAFGQRYDLPIPLQFFYWGAGGALIVSFFLIGWFIDERPHVTTVIDVTHQSFGQFLRHLRWLRWLIQLSSIFLFGLSIYAGFRGSSLVSQNFAPTFFWIIVWIGLPVLSLFLGNIWEVVSPWRTIFEWSIARFWRPRRVYPKAWGVWPALFLYIIFTRLELISDIGYLPMMVAQVLSLYTVFMIGGACVYGTAWFDQADFLAVLSRLIGRISPVALEEGRLIIRIPGTGLLYQPTDEPGIVPFVAFFLAGVTFDGFKESLTANLFILHVLDYLPTLTPAIIHSLELLGIFVAYLSVYYLCRWLIQVVTSTRLPEPGHQFLLSLVPIGAAYTLAHYYSFLLVQGQAIIPLLSDPFGRGDNWFGTANYHINIGLVGAKFVWYSQVSFVVLGHILGVYIAHLVAMRLFNNHKLAMRSQYPVLLLMIGLTICSLWILSAQLGK